MAEEATERVWREDASGVERLVAAPGDPVPEDDAPIGYVEKVDTRAATKQPDEPEEPEDFYEDPPPKPGEEAKARKTADDKSAKKPAASKDS